MVDLFNGLVGVEDYWYYMFSGINEWENYEKTTIIGSI